ncbi:MAG TPA: hypothetical protein VIM62_03760 [Acidobacteriaceae bacterium]
MKRLFAVIALVAAVVFGTAAAQAQASATPGVNGKWHFVLDTPGGDRDVDADFTVDADGKVTGMWGKSNAVGTFHDGKVSLDFQFYSEETGETAAMKIMGTLDDKGVLTGNWQFSSYDGTFTASHPKN